METQMIHGRHVRPECKLVRLSLDRDGTRCVASFTLKTAIRMDLDAKLSLETLEIRNQKIAYVRSLF